MREMESYVLSRTTGPMCAYNSRTNGEARVIFSVRATGYTSLTYSIAHILEVASDMSSISLLLREIFKSDVT